jgi:hypothetical protein
MPEFAIVPIREAQASTIAGRQGRFMNEYVRYIQRLPQRQAGKLHSVENEKPATIRRRLVSAAQALDIMLVIKRSGSDVCFWTEGRREEQPTSKRSYTRRNRRGRAGDYFPPQPFIEPELGEHGVPTEGPRSWVSLSRYLSISKGFW